jgi:hypothetical protein
MLILVQLDNGSAALRPAEEEDEEDEEDEKDEDEGAKTDSNWVDVLHSQ